jgi:pyruvyltransferase
VEGKIRLQPLFAIWEESRNWGDAVNPVLINALSHRKVINVSPYLNKQRRLSSYPKNLFRALLGQPTYMTIGSILAWADKNTVIWGSGFISADERVKEKPKQILAVRGPLSRKIITTQGFDCPRTYGDPALLFSRIYPRNPNPIFTLGIIPHFVDYERAYHIYRNQKGVLVIDITSGIFNVVDQILECEKVASSCLHGLVIADSYNIPSLWLKFSDKVIGGGFKFQDYYFSMNRRDVKPFNIVEEPDTNNILDAFNSRRVDAELCDRLLDACPFNFMGLGK